MGLGVLIVDAETDDAPRCDANDRGVQMIARRMTAWTFTFTGGLFAFAFFGS